jgi:PAS domain S-box-containing protein
VRRDFAAPPSPLLGWSLAVALVAVWSIIRLVIFDEQIFPLSFVLALMVCVWTRDRVMLWSMAGVFTVVAAWKMLIVMPDVLSTRVAVETFAATLVNILVGAALIHLVIALRERLERSLTDLSGAHEQISRQYHELEAQSEELAQQNEELQQQSEELAQQAEHLSQQAEETDAQNEELQIQAEEVQALNAELDRRQQLLQRLLEAQRRQASETTALEAICAAAVDALGEGVAAAIVWERRDDGLVLRAAVGRDGQTVPVASVRLDEPSFSSVALQEDRTASLDDATLRPDLSLPVIEGLAPFSSALAAPFQRAAEPVGTLSVYSEHAREWTAGEFRIVEWLAGQCGLMLASLRLQHDLRESEERFRIMADELPLIIWVHDEKGELEFVNRTYLEFFGTTFEKVLGREWQPLVHPDDADRYLEGFFEALDEQRPFHSQVRVRRADGEWRWIESHGVPRFSSDGRFAGMVGASPDITDRRRAETRQAERAHLAVQLADVDALVHSTLRPDEALDRAVRTAAEAIGCDAAHIALVQESGRWRSPFRWGLPGDLDDREFLEEELPLAALCRERGEVVLTDDLGAERTRDRFTFESLSGLAAPLHVGETFVGALMFRSFTSDHSFSEEQVDFARKLATSVSLALTNNELYEEQRRVARTLQEHFMHPLPAVDGLQLAVVTQAAYDPELVGGDFHDVHQLPDGAVAVLIGDVEGKGVEAAGLTETVRSAVRSLAFVSPSPRYVLNTVNRLLQAEKTEQYVTALLVVLDPRTGRGLMASAGHPAPLLLASGEARYVEPPYGPPLGAFDVDYDVCPLQLEVGDTLVLYTDGLTEARRDDELLGYERLLEAARPLATRGAEEIVERLRDAALGFAVAVKDDLEILALRRTPQASSRDGDGPRLTLTVPMAAGRVGEIRGAVRDFFKDQQVDEDLIEDLVLCIDEGCANSIRHSGSEQPMQVSLAMSDHTVEVVMADEGRGFDLDTLSWELPAETSSAGRGLFLMQALVDEMEVSSGSGTLIRLVKRLTLDGSGNGAAD